MQPENVIWVDLIDPGENGGAAPAEAGGGDAVRVPGQLDVVSGRWIGKGRGDGHDFERLICSDVIGGRKDDDGALFGDAVAVADRSPNDTSTAQVRASLCHGSFRGGLEGVDRLIVPGLRRPPCFRQPTKLRP
jgi:hypothetical protein